LQPRSARGGASRYAGGRASAPSPAAVFRAKAFFGVFSALSAASRAGAARDRPGPGRFRRARVLRGESRRFHAPISTARGVAGRFPGGNREKIASPGKNGVHNRKKHLREWSYGAETPSRARTDLAFTCVPGARVLRLLPLFVFHFF